MTTTVKETLFDIGQARDILEEWLAETEGEVTPEIQQLLDETEGKEADKVERVALFICEKEAIAEMIKAQEQTLAARRKAIEHKIAWLKDSYLRSYLERNPKKKYEGVLKTVALQTNPPSVKLTITAESAIVLDPEIYQRVVRFIRVIPEQREWDKKAMLEAWRKVPGALDGVAIVEQGSSVRIR